MGRGVAELVGLVAGRLVDRGHREHARLLGRTAPSPPSSSSREAGPPVLRHLDDALFRAVAAVPDLGAAVAGPARSARWGRTASYVRSPPNATFLDRYAHATLTGGEGGGGGDGPDAALGLLLLGPHCDYPPHVHPAEELYLPLGKAAWRHARSEPWADEPAGALIHHAPGQPHAMRTGDGPVLMIYVWTGDVGTPSAFCGA